MKTLFPDNYIQTICSAQPMTGPLTDNTVFAFRSSQNNKEQQMETYSLCDQPVYTNQFDILPSTLTYRHFNPNERLYNPNPLDLIFDPNVTTTTSVTLTGDMKMTKQRVLVVYDAVVYDTTPGLIDSAVVLSVLNRKTRVMTVDNLGSINEKIKKKILMDTLQTLDTSKNNPENVEVAISLLTTHVLETIEKKD